MMQFWRRWTCLDPPFAWLYVCAAATAGLQTSSSVAQRSTGKKMPCWLWNMHIHLKSFEPWHRYQGWATQNYCGAPRLIESPRTLSLVLIVSRLLVGGAHGHQIVTVEVVTWHMHLPLARCSWINMQDRNCSITSDYCLPYASQSFAITFDMTPKPNRYQLIQCFVINWICAFGGHLFDYKLHCFHKWLA